MSASTCAALAAVLLTACSSGVQGGQTPAQASETAAAIPGVASAEVVNESISTAPFERSEQATITLTLEPGWVVDDAPGLMTWAIKTGWSLNSEKIDYGIVLWIASPDGSPAVDWNAAAEEIGLPGGWPGAKSYGEHGYVFFWPDHIAAVVDQPWPADPPPVPENAFALGSD